jgi:hypothetical protein
MASHARHNPRSEHAHGIEVTVEGGGRDEGMAWRHDRMPQLAKMLDGETLGPSWLCISNQPLQTSNTVRHQMNRQAPKWSAEEEDYLKVHWCDTLDSVSMYIGRSHQAIVEKRQRMRIRGDV